MKNLAKVVMIAMLATLVVSCAQDPVEEILEDPIIYVLQDSPNGMVYELLEGPAYTSPSTKDISYKNGNSVHTHGNIVSGFGGNHNISWSGTENNGGTHGSAELYKSSSSGVFHFIFETECIMADGNEAVYGGTITEIIEKTGGGPPIQVGWHYYFKVIDNGQGANAPADLYGNLLVASPNSLCGVWTPDFFFWDLVGTSPVNAPGSVKINN